MDRPCRAPAGCAAAPSRRSASGRSEVPDVPEAPDGIAIVGVDRDGEAYTQHYFDSRGVARVYAMTFRDGVWTLLRDAPDFTPLACSSNLRTQLPCCGTGAGAGCC